KCGMRNAECGLSDVGSKDKKGAAVALFRLSMLAGGHPADRAGLVAGFFGLCRLAQPGSPSHALGPPAPALSCCPPTLYALQPGCPQFASRVSQTLAGGRLFCHVSPCAETAGGLAAGISDGDGCHWGGRLWDCPAFHWPRSG